MVRMAGVAGLLVLVSRVVGRDFDKFPISQRMQLHLEKELKVDLASWGWRDVTQHRFRISGGALFQLVGGVGGDRRLVLIYKAPYGPETWLNRGLGIAPIVKSLVDQNWIPDMIVEDPRAFCRDVIPLLGGLPGELGHAGLAERLEHSTEQRAWLAQSGKTKALLQTYLQLPKIESDGIHWRISFYIFCSGGGVDLVDITAENRPTKFRVLDIQRRGIEKYGTFSQALGW